MINKARN